MIKPKSLAEIMEEVHESLSTKQIQNEAWEKEEKRERSMSECHFEMEIWKKKYCATKKSKNRVSIRALTHGILLDGEWKNYHSVQLFVNGSHTAEINVRPEAFDVITRGLEFTLLQSGSNTSSHVANLFTFEPIKK